MVSLADALSNVSMRVFEKSNFSVSLFMDSIPLFSKQHFNQHSVMLSESMCVHAETSSSLNMFDRLLQLPFLPIQGPALLPWLS